MPLLTNVEMEWYHAMLSRLLVAAVSLSCEVHGRTFKDKTMRVLRAEQGAESCEHESCQILAGALRELSDKYGDAFLDGASS